VVSFNDPVIKTGDSTDVIKSLGTPTTKSAIGANSTFTVTQPSVSLATDTTSGTGKVQVMTGVDVAYGSDHIVDAVIGYTPSTDTFLKGVKVTA
jgi:hypothetical protein